MNEYLQITEFKAYPGSKITGSGDNSLIYDLLTEASRLIDEETGRFFYEITETRKFDCPRKPYVDLVFDWPLLSLTTLTNGNGTTISSSDYFLYPDPNNPPFMWLELDKSSGIVWEYSDTPQQAIQVAGKWGWHEDYSRAWESSGDTVQDDPLSDSATSLGVSDGTNFDPQQMLLVESEQIYISSISGNTLTVVRGCNGTTAAEHAKGKAISIYKPQPTIKKLCKRIALWLYKQRDGMFETTGHPELGITVVPTALPSDIKRGLMRLRKL